MLEYCVLFVTPNHCQLKRFLPVLQGCEVWSLQAFNAKSTEEIYHRSFLTKKICKRKILFSEKPRRFDTWMNEYSKPRFWMLKLELQFALIWTLNNPVRCWMSILYSFFWPLKSNFSFLLIVNFPFHKFEAIKRDWLWTTTSLLTNQKINLRLGCKISIQRRLLDLYSLVYFFAMKSLPIHRCVVRSCNT